jgi:hypothetical protein
VDDRDSARRYRERFRLARERLDRELWNGEYYIQRDDPTKHEDEPHYAYYGDGCLSDQLVGQWWAHLLDLGHLLPEERVRGALRAILRYNWRTHFADFKQGPRRFAGPEDKGLLNCTWPRGNRPKRPIWYSDEVWTGVEFEVAALMLREGMIPEALAILKGISERYDGRPRPPFPRNPWNHIEAGERYVRALSSWSVLLFAQGIVYDGPGGVLGFRPRLHPERFQSFFSTAEGWGSFRQSRSPNLQKATLQLRYGRLRLREFRLWLPPEAFRTNQPPCVSIRRGTERVDAKVRFDAEERSLRLMWNPPLLLRAGERFSVSIEWEEGKAGERANASCGP